MVKPIRTPVDGEVIDTGVWLKIIAEKVNEIIEEMNKEE